MLLISWQLANTVYSVHNISAGMYILTIITATLELGQWPSDVSARRLLMISRVQFPTVTNINVWICIYNSLCVKWWKWAMYICYTFSFINYKSKLFWIIRKNTLLYVLIYFNNENASLTFHVLSCVLDVLLTYIKISV